MDRTQEIFKALELAGYGIDYDRGNIQDANGYKVGDFLQVGAGDVAYWSIKGVYFADVGAIGSNSVDIDLKNAYFTFGAADVVKSFELLTVGKWREWCNTIGAEIRERDRKVIKSINGKPLAFWQM